MIPCTNHYFLVEKKLICQWKWPWLKSYLCSIVCYYLVSSEDRLTGKPWVQIYFSVRTFRVLAAMLFSSCEIDDGVARRLERRRENVLLWFSFGPSHLPSRQFRLMKTTLQLCNLPCIAHYKVEKFKFEQDSNHDLCYSSAVLYQLSYQVNWE